MESKLPRRTLGNVKYVESYDFKHPKLFSKEIMRTLQAIHEVFSRNLSRILSSSLRYKVDVYLQKVDQLSSSEFAHEIKSPSTIYLLEVNELGGEVVVVLPPEFCIHLIERQSGGAEKQLSERRILTVIEEKIMSRIMGSISNEVVLAWEPYMDFKVDGIKYESKPENLNLAAVDPNIVVKFEVDLGGQKIQIGISYSYSLLKKAMNDTIMKKGVNSRKERLSEEEMESYKRTLEKANIRIQSLLGTTRLTLDEIMNLKEGDTIPLRQKSDKPLEIRVNGVKKMTAYPGVIQGHRAVKIFELLEEINEQELV
ncbi:MAG: flagellar motor switch protein FliM [Gracilimonas sp.]|uniref:flagellar motor switch protein FliM n=1 Tax=Gracilimonas TaxID=649462 RepID=UPI001B212569|nr:FliM/FliN family flagellar motor switch protein [Gracilimonas sp.]MBO6586846.1 flagellar motor switch protein FliM [Gracilimonas sp.]MBO6614666.1 flagellar motor switch protein FliM [Gracilimonas sp.]